MGQVERIGKAEAGGFVGRLAQVHAAVAPANDSRVGCGGLVFVQGVARARRLEGRLDTGVVFFNPPTWTGGDLPLGGVKNSGYGRELSALGFREFVTGKLVRTILSGARARSRPVALRVKNPAPKLEPTPLARVKGGGIFRKLWRVTPHRSGAGNSIEWGSKGANESPPKETTSGKSDYEQNTHPHLARDHSRPFRRL